MKKGISFFYGWPLPSEERVKAIKEAGFDCVITTADKRFNRQNGIIQKQIKLFKKYGLGVSSLHMAYKSEELHYFWEEGKMGEKYTKSLIKDVKYAKKYGFSCVVVHLFGEYSSIGEERLRRVLKVCEKCNIPLAIENIDCQKVFLETFDHIKHDYLKFCYDSGHNHTFDPDFNYFEKFGDKLIALHLHDNDGSGDQHTVNELGTIDWKWIAQNLKGKDIVLDYEMLMCVGKDKYSPDDVLKIAKKQADELEKLIEE